MSDEQQLIEAAKGGSVDAFSELVRGYRGGLFRFLVARCANHADAEDVLQDTLINAYRYIGSYNPQWRFSTWLYRIAMRNASRLRSEKLAELGDPEDAGADPLAHCLAESERANLWRSAKRVLPDDVFTAMWLRYVEDMSVRDIASVLGRSSSWTKVNLLRGRRALEAEMNGRTGNAGSEAYG